MKSKNCLNCGSQISDNYCSSCGQQTDMHRITFKNFLFHDVLHGVFHIEKGMLFTAKEALKRPGQAALDYIAGKRKRYYNVFYLILITIALLIFTRHVDEWVSSNNPTIEVTEKKQFLNEASQQIDELFAQKNKIIIFLFVPISALNSFLLFRRKRLNLSEHAIIAGMILLGILLISTFSNVLFWFNLVQSIGQVVSVLIASLIILYICFGYYNAFSSDYTRVGICARILAFFVLIFLELMFLLWLLIGYYTNWEFGEVQVSPFS